MSCLRQDGDTHECYRELTAIDLPRRMQSDVEQKNPKLAEQIHIFSSFFYKKLTTKDRKVVPYDTIKKWTSKFDLFKKKYIFIPINEKYEWPLRGRQSGLRYATAD